MNLPVSLVHKEAGVLANVALFLTSDFFLSRVYLFFKFLFMNCQYTSKLKQTFKLLFSFSKASSNLA